VVALNLKKQSPSTGRKLNFTEWVLHGVWVLDHLLVVILLISWKFHHNYIQQSINIPVIFPLKKRRKEEEEEEETL
jgi:hypothetical protein